METVVKKVNSFFRTAIKPEVDVVKENLLLTPRQDRIFTMYYINHQDVTCIAEELSVCQFVINHELKTIRDKLVKII